jgi:hypothetical protein
MDPSEDHDVKQILCVHRRALSPSGGQSLRNERTENFPHSFTSCFLRRDPLDLGKPLDPATTSSTILHKPRQAGSAQVDEPPRILWIGWLPMNIAWHSQNFWCYTWACCV